MICQRVHFRPEFVTNAFSQYLSKAFFHGLPTVLCKIVGVYQIGYHNRVTGKRTMEQVGRCSLFFDSFI